MFVSVVGRSRTRESMAAESILSGEPSSGNAIAVTVGANYFEILCTFLDTLVQNYPDHPDVVICYRNFSPDQIRLLTRRYAQLRLADIDRFEFPVGPGMQHRKRVYDLKVFYSRLLMWTDMFADYDVVLYLDVDVLVLRPLDHMLGHDFYAAAESYEGPDSVLYDDLQGDWLPLMRQHGIADRATQKAANAGVIAVGRRYRTPEQLDLLRTILDRFSPYLSWGDQSMLNVWMWFNGLEAEPDYSNNFQVRLLTERKPNEAFRTARILHFNGLSTLGIVLHLMQMARTLLAVPRIGYELFTIYYRLLDLPGAKRIARSGWVAIVNWAYWLRQDYDPRSLHRSLRGGAPSRSIL